MMADECILVKPSYLQRTPAGVVAKVRVLHGVAGEVEADNVAWNPADKASPQTVTLPGFLADACLEERVFAVAATDEAAELTPLTARCQQYTKGAYVELTPALVKAGEPLPTTVLDVASLGDVDTAVRTAPEAVAAAPVAPTDDDTTILAALVNWGRAYAAALGLSLYRAKGIDPLPVTKEVHRG
jgi:hypothetical protein